MKKLLTFLTLFLVAIGVFAVPAEREAKDIYDASGRQTHKLHRGLNIIRMSDGTEKKVVVR